MKIANSLIALLVFLPLGAMENYDTYKGIELTPATLADLCKMPPELEVAVSDWTEKHKEFLQTVIKSTNEVVTDKTKLGAEIAKNKAAIDKNRLVNYGTSDFVFKLPRAVNGNIYYIKFAGPINKAISVLHSNKKVDGTYYGWELENLTDGLIRTKTYQTVSSLAYFLKAKEKIENDKITSIIVPTTYCAQVPGRSSVAEFAMDENCLLVQQEIPNTLCVNDNLDHLEQFNKERLNTLLGYIWHVGFWNPKGKLLYDVTSGKSVITSFQQPNNTNSDKFFQQNKDKSAHDRTVGTQEIVELFKAAAKVHYNVTQQQNDLLDLVQNSSYIRADKKDLIKNSFN